MLFPAFCQENLLMPSKGFGLFRLMLSKGLVFFEGAEWCLRRQSNFLFE
jgi:hypothetical protein